ncbi:baseplate J/gp47 family protein [Archangium violaceum]|uniref:baseplate J/gp47 family protein n=1 Tax=Archangium violaceum TaxID=83451 RepID=UPI002B2A66DD|nr:baseplate J/gp47 family protein [Archangium gephyra]
MSALFDSQYISYSAIVERLLEGMGPRSDTTDGGVVRTLLETYAREMATFYGMLELAYQSGFLDTAEGDALDNVVAVLGIRRARAGRLTGTVEFSRASPAPEDIGIPAGRQVTGTLVEGTPLPLFETSADAVIRRGEMRVTVGVQELQTAESGGPPLPVINPGMLNLMPRPILGVETVTNPDPLRRSSEDETDDDLRARARTALRDGEKGTLESIAAAVREQGIRQVTVREPVDGPAGVIDVVIGDPDLEKDAGRVARVDAAIRASKAAGVRVNLNYARSIYLQPTFQVEPADENLDERGFERLRVELQAQLVRFAASLSAGTLVSRRKLEAVLFGNPAVRNVTDVKMATYSWKEGVLVAEQEARETGASRDWRMGPLELPLIDPDQKPPLISWYQPLYYRLDLVVSINSNDRRAADVVRQDVRTAVELYGADLGRVPGTGIQWTTLELALVSRANVKELLGVVITAADTGLATVLKKVTPDKDTPPGLVMRANGRLVLGGAEIVGAA